MSDSVDDIVARITEERPIVLIDGRSGAGKTQLATAVARRLFAEVVRLDSIYPGWDGLEAASAQVRGIIETGTWQRFNWRTNELAEWHALGTEWPLIIEGSGSLTRANREVATLGIWVELDEPTRRARALERDGETYAPHWDRWAAQEQAFFERERPDLVADVIVAG